MNVFIACLATETNSFSPIPTGRQSYEGVFYARGDATSKKAIFFDEPLHSCLYFWSGDSDVGPNVPYLPLSEILTAMRAGENEITPCRVYPCFRQV